MGRRQCALTAHRGCVHLIPLRSISRSYYTFTAHRGCVHLIIDTEEIIIANVAPAEMEGSNPLPDEGEDGHPCPGKPAGLVAATAALELLQEGLLPRLFPGVSPQLPPSQSQGAEASVTAITIQLQQSVIAPLKDEAPHFPTPPSVVGVNPAAVCCQLSLPSTPSLPPTASPPTDAACLPISGSWITVWLQLSASLPSEGVTLLARYRGGFLDARLEQADENDGALIIKVRAF